MLSKPDPFLRFGRKTGIKSAQLGQPSNQLGSGIERNLEVGHMWQISAADFPDMGANMKREERDTRA